MLDQLVRAAPRMHDRTGPGHVKEHTFSESQKEDSHGITEKAQRYLQDKEQAARMLENWGKCTEAGNRQVGNARTTCHMSGGHQKWRAWAGAVLCIPADISDQDFKEAFRNINQDEMTGILLLRPLPKQMREADIER